MKAVSPLIGMVLVVAFGFAAMGIVLTVVRPLLDSAKDSGLINEATQNMQLVDSAVKAVASEAKGSKRTIHVKITEGVLRTNGSVDWVYLDYEPKSRMKLDGFTGDVRIESSPFFLEYFNWYGDGNNANQTWTSVNGSWSVSSGRFLGTGGIAYHNIGNRTGFELSSSVIPSTAPHGQVYAVPGDPRDLVLYLPFDGNINTTERIAYDYSAYRNNGTFTNFSQGTCFTNNACPSWVEGRFGNATQYDGIGDLVNISGPQFNFGSGDFTLALWFKFESVQSDGQKYVFAFRNSDNTRSITLRSENVLTNKQLKFEINDPDGDSNLITTASNAWTNEQWAFLTGLRNGSDIVFYINNIPLGKSTNAAVGSVTDSGTYLRLGAPAGSNLARFFNGTIDEVMVFKRALTPNEISFLYESSIKKITSAGEIQSIGSKENVTLVLSSPGSTYFDNVKVKAGASLLRFVVPYQNIDIVNQSRFGSGDHNIVIKHYGINTTTNRPMIGIE